METALESTKRATEQILEHRAAGGDVYRKPQEEIAAEIKELRRSKMLDRQARAKILLEKVDMAASDVRKAALVFRFLEEQKRSENKLKKVGHLHTS